MSNIQEKNYEACKKKWAKHDMHMIGKAMAIQ